jgi:anion-transporting  ArsA/GET3 family ATPase
VASLWERKLVVVTGKGGVGKTTVSAALGLLGAQRGLRTIVAEVSPSLADPGSAVSDSEGAGRLAALLDHPEPLPHGVETQLRERLWGLSIDRDRVLVEWLRAVGGRVPARLLTSSGSFQHLVAATPGGREMLSAIKVWELAEGRRPADRGKRGGTTADRDAPGGSTDGDARPSSTAAAAEEYDLVILDAPATGHALALLRAPHTYAALARVGPMARQAGQVRDLLADPARSAYVAVARPTEMAVTETLELRASLRRDLGRELDAVIVNATLPRRFEGEDLRRIAALNGGAAPTDTASRRRTGDHDGHAATRAAMRAAHTVHERARFQQSQIARLRRDGEHSGAAPVLSVPFLFCAELDLEGLERIADRLARGL